MTNTDGSFTWSHRQGRIDQGIRFDGVGVIGTSPVSIAPGATLPGLMM